MISESVLYTAIERGIISREQASSLDALRLEIAQRDSAGTALSDPDDEKLRFISGFNDIFVSIGISLFMGALILLLSDRTHPTAMCATVAAFSWALAELFTRRRRLALPSILLLISFACSMLLASIWAMPLIGGSLNESSMIPSISIISDQPRLMIMASLITLAFLALHYWRFRVPITIAAGAAVLSLAAMTAILNLWPIWGWTHLNGLLFVCGLSIFALAMRFDLRDLERTSRRTDIAFWLHLLAAVLTVHPMVTAFIGESGLDNLDRDTAITVLATLLGLTLLALIIDRRAILTSGLIYAGYAFYSLIDQADFSSSATALSLLALGGYVLIISAFWRPFRNSLLRLLPMNIALRLPQSAISRA